MPSHPDTPAEIRADAVVVGAGPVGTTLAILLGQQGVDVVVLERWPEPYPLPRAVHMDHEVARIFQNAGLGGDLPALTEPAPIYEWRNAVGSTLLKFGRTSVSRSGWPESMMFNQPALEAALARRAEALPSVRVLRGSEVVGLHESTEGVVLDTRDVVGDDRGGPVLDARPTTVVGRFVIGCDGANSAVRALAGLPVHDLGFFYDWLIVDAILHEDREFDPINVQICDPARPTTAVSGGPGRRRWEFMRLPGERVEDLHTLERAWELLAPWDVHPRNATLERHTVYTFQARYAEQWQTAPIDGEGPGRVFIAGDAAHLMPPFAGQGMCSGIRDAANLAWKLAMVLDGTAHPWLLGSYQTERMPGARQAIEFSMELGKVICVRDPAEAATRDALMSAGVTDEPAEAPPLPGIDGGFVDPASPGAGAPFGQGSVDGTLIDTVYGPGWKLLTSFDEVSLDDEVRAWFASIGGLVLRVDHVDGYRGWLAEYNASAALQRPDLHLYGSASDAVAAGDLLSRLRTHLSEGALP